MWTFDPLEQFSIEIYSGFFNNLIASSISSLGFMIFFIFFLIWFAYYSFNSVFLLNKFQKGIINLFYLVLGILKDSVSIKKYSFILLFYCTFLFIFLSNILGMIPYSITITSRTELNLTILFFKTKFLISLLNFFRICGF